MINQCFILCGGYGSRLKKITSRTPKPLLKYFGKEFLTYLIENLSNQGVTEINLLTYFKNKIFKKYKKKIEKKFLNLKINIINEKTKSGTGGALIKSYPYQKKLFFLINGDSYFDINLRDFEKKSKSKNILTSIATVEVENKKKNNSFKIKNDILQKIYKTQKNKIKKSGGIYIVNKDIFKKYINQKKLPHLDFDKDIIYNQINSNKIKAITFKANFLDIGESIKIFETSKKKLYTILQKPCCFLDRDGVINFDKGYTHKIKDFIFRPYVKEAIKYLNDKRYYVAIVTNQSGIARGYFDEIKLNKLHNFMSRKFYNYGAYIDKIYYSPFHKNGIINKYKKNSKFRKPNIGMLELCYKELKFKKKGSFLIGDKSTDLEAAKKFNINGYLVKENIFKQIKKII